MSRELVPVSSVDPFNLCQCNDCEEWQEANRDEREPRIAEVLLASTHFFSDVIFIDTGACIHCFSSTTSNDDRISWSGKNNREIRRASISWWHANRDSGELGLFSFTEQVMLDSLLSRRHSRPAGRAAIMLSRPQKSRLSRELADKKNG